ncbi:hypothetical protein STAIW_v1c04130 [Spiroplasma taiwanense CT-1]|uniref:Uncharacterized protein n=1 Tax=Spiroplasma taiwanense CT-1 TaxID=1276220 RepID=S5MBB6_9MOLU|nr:hypothetical protein STAIW_v1c04130 [Spiroplasma taiwanense CT-1]
MKNALENYQDELLFNSIFNKITENDEALIFEKSNKNINSPIYKEISSSFMNVNNEYEKQFASEITNFEALTGDKLDDSVKAVVNNSIKYYEVKLKNLSIKIGTAYENPINNLSFFSSLQLQMMKLQKIEKILQNLIYLEQCITT